MPLLGSVSPTDSPWIDTEVREGLLNQEEGGSAWIPKGLTWEGTQQPSSARPRKSQEVPGSPPLNRCAWQGRCILAC